jgi:hypothetical protein
MDEFYAHTISKIRTKVNITADLFTNINQLDTRSPAVQGFFAGLLEMNTLLVSVISCQCISNVPTAILLSQFTQNYADLLVGVNIGGVGTLIASLASLITFREYAKHNQGRMLRYVLVFTLFNFLFLIVLCAFQLIFF